MGSGCLEKGGRLSSYQNTKDSWEAREVFHCSKTLCWESSGRYFFVLNTTKAQSALEKQTTCAILNLCQERKFEISECSDLHSDFFCLIWQLLNATRTTIRDMGACLVSHLLLFFKCSLQLSVAQVSVRLLSIPTSPPGGNRAATQLGPDPTFFEQQPAEAGVPAGGVPVMGAGSVATIPKAVQSCYGCHHYRQQLDDLACHHHLDPHPGHLWNCGSLFQTAQ